MTLEEAEAIRGAARARGEQVDIFASIEDPDYGITDRIAVALFPFVEGRPDREAGE